MIKSLYQDLNDYEVIYLAQENNEEALEIIEKKYLNLINTKSYKAYCYLKKLLFSIDYEEIKQECIISFHKSIYKFNEKINTSFYTYTSNFIDKDLISYERKILAIKNSHNNNAISLEEEINENSNIIDIIKDYQSNPETIAMTDDFKIRIINIINNKLTKYEQKLIKLRLNNYSYKEIASILSKKETNIYKSMNKIRNKLRNLEEFYN